MLGAPPPSFSAMPKSRPASAVAGVVWSEQIGAYVMAEKEKTGEAYNPEAIDQLKTKIVKLDLLLVFYGIVSEFIFIAFTWPPVYMISKHHN